MYQLSLLTASTATLRCSDVFVSQLNPWSRYTLTALLQVEQRKQTDGDEIRQSVAASVKIRENTDMTFF